MSLIQEKIKKDIETHPIILFMKGSKLMPLCGFSGQVVSILSELGVDFESRNVLEDEELRQGIKEYSNWPTLPQLYVRGKFIGGCDIVSKLHDNGELEALLK
ncbi:MAG: Grx4 family monothiol glutaredoxin [Chlamydiia bacterium]|nr:Grx4 family monothiol glutaredoxin [Chlamydiia bacterium]